jgi:hypothetical protein
VAIISRRCDSSIFDLALPAAPTEDRAPVPAARLRCDAAAGIDETDLASVRADPELSD